MTMQLLNELVELAGKVTALNLDTAQSVKDEDGYIECPLCCGEGHVDAENDYCNIDAVPLGVQFYGIGPEHGLAEQYFRAANPAAILAIAEYVKGLEEIRAAAEKLVRCKGRYHSEQNYRALASLFGVVTPDLHHIPDAGKAIPKGWRLMPDEPTAEMMKAMYQAQDMWPNAHCDNQRELEMSFARPRYIAALATAPGVPND
ncbi:MAG: hypothetical protein PW844_19000 [Pantoea sp.]|uniref:hypothetical protein n=1 Tax=Pantoea sp. TaxID=69393 RepID=UPI00238C4EDB|nr:hypothetical protein [Pantoea sp.]MDE1188537.1 hypothetical protein [Pantoea sp.]